MPPPNSRMTANPARPVARHRAGKPTVQETEQSSSESESEEEEKEEEQRPKAPAPRPAASSFPGKTAGISTKLQQTDLNARKPPPAKKPDIDEDEFETEESDASGSEGSESEEDSSEEEESSSEDEKPVRLRPVFIKKSQRDAQTGASSGKGPPQKAEDELWAEEQARKKERADAMIQEELEKQAALKAAGKKYWDDEDNIVDDVDDTDGIDPEAELAAWKLREIKRLKRDQDAIIAAEKEREEIERRRNLSKEEREAEDAEHLAKQQAEKEGKGKMAYMQKYFHKGAFFGEDAGELKNRDIMGGRFEDDAGVKEALPEYMRVRDMTKLGKKGRTRYKDMRSEDTGRWGDHLSERRGPRRDGEDFRGGDERFRPDYDGGGGRDGPSGANASALGERKRPLPSDDRRDDDKRARVS